MRIVIDRAFDSKLNDRVIAPLYSALDNQVRHVDIWINSSGGQVYVMNQIVDLMELLKRNDTTVATHVSGRAFSAGAYVAVAGSEGHRYVSPSANYLIHYGAAGGWRVHTPEQVGRQAKHWQEHFDMLVGHFERYTNIPDLRDKMKDDDFLFNAQQALEWGVADQELYTYVNSLQQA